MNEDILLDFIKNKVTETVTEEVTSVVTDELVATTEMSVEEQTWGVVDIMLETGAAEGIAGALGAPLVIIIGIKVFRQWRRKMKEAEKQNG
jgi:hypothetical protein